MFLSAGTPNYTPERMVFCVTKSGLHIVLQQTNIGHHVRSCSDFILQWLIILISVKDIFQTTQKKKGVRERICYISHLISGILQEKTNLSM